MRRDKKIFCLSLIITVFSFITSNGNNDIAVITSKNPSAAESLASKEIRRYIYLRTGEMLSVIHTDALSSSQKEAVVIAVKGTPFCKSLMLQYNIDLKDYDYCLKTVVNNDQKLHLIIGRDSINTLYGAYNFIEKLGIRFYLHGDVIPDKKIPLSIPELNEQCKALFDIRGIQPFHDFPEGPDWWNIDDYKAIIAQLVKMRMNFIGFHTYPEQNLFNGHYKAEPMTWIGFEQDINNDGTVKSAYPVLHFHTKDSTWGYLPKNTGDYSFGGSELFETDNYGADYIKSISPWPHTQKENIQLFNDFGKILNNTFAFAHKLGVKTCIGTEVPLIIPMQVKEKYHLPDSLYSDSLIKALYRGMFKRINLVHNLDYYWFWTGEDWTWNGTTEKEVKKVEKDLLLAVEAAKEMKVNFTLATCGWVLGPPNNMTQFDKILPVNMPFSCINRTVGFAPLEDKFKEISSRPKWAIPWMEDDPGLTSPQLWAGRMRKDASDALSYGCSGLIGIHWRTQILGPTVSALAYAGWNQDYKNKSVPGDTRDMFTEDFYNDWSVAQFGEEAAADIAKIFVKLDGGPLKYNDKGEIQYVANLFRTSEWAGKGPGGIKILQQSWQEVSVKFDFINELLLLKPRITGKGNIERFDYWLNTFQYAKSATHLGCVLGELEKKMKAVKDEQDINKKYKIAEEALLLRMESVNLYGELMTYMLQSVSTNGELGTIANLEQHNLLKLQRLTKHDSLLTAIIGEPLLKETILRKEYQGISKIIVPAKRTLLEKGENLELKVIILSQDSLKEAFFYWRNIGTQKFDKIPLHHIARGVYDVTLPAGKINQNDFEYYIEADFSKGEKLYYPATAPELNSSVVVMD